MRISRWLRLTLLSTVLLGTIVACSDDDDGDIEAYCDATVRIETVGEPDVDFETASEEEIAEAAKKFASDTLRPIADEIVDAAPGEVADDIALLSGAVDELAETGDFEAAFETEEVEEASDRAHAFDLENCGWDQVDVTAVDYAFRGLGDTPAGTASFELSNEGKEPHEFVLFRRNEGVTETIEEILALERGEAESKVTLVARTFAEPGESDYAVAELEPGGYGAVCFIPVGGGEDGPPHFTEGMFAEFTVS